MNHYSPSSKILPIQVAIDELRWAQNALTVLPNLINGKRKDAIDLAIKELIEDANLRVSTSDDKNPLITKTAALPKSEKTISKARSNAKSAKRNKSKSDWKPPVKRPKGAEKKKLFSL